MYPDHFQNWLYFGHLLLILVQLTKQVKIGGSRHSLDNAWKEWPEIKFLMYPDHLQNYFDFGHDQLIFLFLVQFWLVKRVKFAVLGYNLEMAWNESPEIKRTHFSAIFTYCGILSVERSFSFFFSSIYIKHAYLDYLLNIMYLVLGICSLLFLSEDIASYNFVFKSRVANFYPWKWFINHCLCRGQCCIFCTLVLSSYTCILLLRNG